MCNVFFSHILFMALKYNMEIWPLILLTVCEIGVLFGFMPHRWASLRQGARELVSK